MDINVIRNRLLSRGEEDLAAAVEEANAGMDPRRKAELSGHGKPPKISAKRSEIYDKLVDTAVKKHTPHGKGDDARVNDIWNDTHTLLRKRTLKTRRDVHSYVKDRMRNVID